MDKSNKQKILIEYLISSVDTYAICKSIIKSEYFSPEFRNSVSFIDKYYTDFNALPTPYQIYSETNVTFELQQVTKDRIQWCSTELEKFCKRKALEHAVIKSSELIGTPSEGKIESIIKEATQISLTKDLGIQYFDDPESRLREYAKEPARISTGYVELDRLLGGGLARTEMILVSANSGGGKSITLSNLAINYLEQGFNVMYISLELSEKLIQERFNTHFTGIPTMNWESNIDNISNKINSLKPNMGNLVIKRFSSNTNSNVFRSYIKEYALKFDHVPDLLIIDYLDIMGTNENISVENVSQKDKAAAEQFKDILDDYNMMGATASQQNRSAVEAKELNQSHIAGGMTKINAVDWYFSILFTVMMKSMKEFALVCLKARSSSGLGEYVNLEWDNNSLRIRNKAQQANPDSISTKIAEQKETKLSLFDIMDI